MVLRLNSGDPGFADAFDALVDARREVDPDVDQAVAEIIADVRARGDAALLELSARFDRLELADGGEMRVKPAEIEAARAASGNEAVAALELAAGRIESYHRRQMPEDMDYTDGDGIRLGARWRAQARP